MTSPKIVIAGGGVASLSAAIHMRDLMPKARIRLLTDVNPERLGGHLVSWNESGFEVEHGLHALFGFYEEALRLLERVGAMENFQQSGSHIYACRNGRLKKFAFSSMFLHAGFSHAERIKLLQFNVELVRLAAEVALNGGKAFEKYDHLDFRTWARKAKIPASLVESSFFDQFYAAAFNDPHELSALVAMQSLWGCAKKPWHYYFRKPSKEALILPLVDYFINKCGGEILYGHRVLKLNSDPHSRHVRSLTVQIDGKEGVHEFGADAFVLALGVEDFKALDVGALQNHPYFSRIQELQSAASISMQAWFRHDPVPAKLDSLIGGFPKPFVVLCPISKITGLPRPGPFAHELIGCGSEKGFENQSDEELISDFITQLKENGFHPKGDLRHGADAYYKIQRNRAPSERYLLTTPGTWKLRPETQTPYDNVFLAGAWIKNDWALPCVEAAVQSGHKAAQKAAQQCALRDTQALLPALGRYHLDTQVLPPPFVFPASTGSFFLLDRNPDFEITLPASVKPSPLMEGKLLLAIFEHKDVQCLKDPTSTLYSYNEVMLAMLVRHNDELGLYPLTLFVDDDTALTAGRELYGFPKKFARVQVQENSLEVQRIGRPLADFDSQPHLMSTKGAQNLMLLDGAWKKSGGAIRDWGLKMGGQLLSATEMLRLPFFNHLRIFDPQASGALAISRLTRSEMAELRIERSEWLHDANFKVGGSLQDPLAYVIEHRDGNVEGLQGLKMHFSFELR